MPLSQAQTYRGPSRAYSLPSISSLRTGRSRAITQTELAIPEAVRGAPRVSWIGSRTVAEVTPGPGSCLCSLKRASLCSGIPACPPLAPSGHSQSAQREVPEDTLPSKAQRLLEQLGGK